MNASAEQRTLLQALGFSPKENVLGILEKEYTDGYCLAVDFDNQYIDYGNQISFESKTTQNFSQAENWVVLECVNRLLEKGYQPKGITLEKTFPSGHGHSGRLDIFVEKEGKAFLMIECKTFGKEYDKELNNLHKDGGQLFTYFQNDTAAEVLMLYTSRLGKNNDVDYVNTIVNIEDEYRETSNVKDFYDRWNKLPKQNGIFDAWVNPYRFESKALTIDELVEIKQEDSSFIFNQFLEILRHNVVSDKGNAFNRIFTLFLCKIYDEKVNEGTSNELGFQWLDGKDDHRSFQLRLTDLYKNGMYEFLEKVVTDFSETEFNNKFPKLNQEYRPKIIDEFRKIRLEKNNEFAIKDVYDQQSFEDNAVVVKEIVELLQKFKLRYSKKQQYLSDFFELLLTTGLKQESGQFFTPVPVAQFVIKSLPVDKMVEEKLSEATLANDKLLPYVMDYAAGSGHFLTEMMHVIQSELNQKSDKDYSASVAKEIRNWKDDHFKWAIQYIYGIEKDYRLVKVGKVGCYLHGDGLANVIHSDGLARFDHPDYKGKLLETDVTYPKENKQFDIVVSNPPYSVSAFRNSARKYYTGNDFDSYGKLTDQSSEIECLFIERTKQLLQDGGVAGIILPSSILSNTGSYTKAREILLQYFELIGIAEFGSNTFMATGTNTVTLFLRRRSNYQIDSLKQAVANVLTNKQDITLNGIETPISRYVAHVWDGLSYEDYLTLLDKQPNEVVQQHELYKEYRQKIKSKNEAEFWQILLQSESEKHYYFVITYPQKVVIVKTGEKKAEKQFLGYEFSNRRGSEGIHPIQRGKEIHECTQLFDENSFTNPEKASTYIYKAFANNSFSEDIPDSLKDNIGYQNLVDMLSFDRVDFEKSISLAVKKKVTIDSQWGQEILSNLVSFQSGLWTGKKGKLINTKVLRNTNFKLNNGKLSYDDIAEIDVEEAQLKKRVLEFGDILLEKSGGSDTQAIGRVVLFDKVDGEIYSYSNFCSRIRAMDSKRINSIYLWLILHKFYVEGGTKALQNGIRLLNIDLEGYKRIKVPLPPLSIQQKIVDEIAVLEQQEDTIKNKVEELNKAIFAIIRDAPLGKVSDLCVISNKKIVPNTHPDTQFVYLGLEHIESDSGKITEKNIEFGRNIRSSKNVFGCGDVLYGKLRPYLNKVFLSNFEGICSTDILVLKTESPTLLKYALLAKEFVEQTSELMQGVSLPRISAKVFLNQPIPLPPLTEREKIVAEIEKIENQITVLETQLTNIPEQKEAILKKYL